MRPRSLAALTALTALAVTACTVRGGTGRLGVRMDLVDPPRAVPLSSGRLFVYEAEVRNTGERAVRLGAVGRDDGISARAPLRGDELTTRLVPRQRATDPADRVRLEPASRAVVLLDVRVGEGETVPAFAHDVTVAREEPGSVPEVVTAPLRSAAGDPPVLLGPPLRGDRWLLENGPAVVSGHRRAVVWLHGRPRAAQRFAVDFFRTGPDGATSSGDRRKNESYFAFGAEVLAVAGGVVVAARDGIPDNVPDARERAVEMSGETIAGNHVVLDLGSGRFALFAHLRCGSVSVRAGDRVATGQVLGALGNSGNSTEPHLHLHVADGPSPVDASGLPFVFAAFECGGRQFAGVLPGEGSVVTFGTGSNSATSGAPSDAATR